jgi:hypothetical protein
MQKPTLKFDVTVPSDAFIEALFMMGCNDKRIPCDLQQCFYELREKYHEALDVERDRMQWLDPDGYFGCSKN